MAEFKQKLSPLLRVFVYGTLKLGEANYQRYCAGKVVDATRAIALGELFALPMGFPLKKTCVARCRQARKALRPCSKPAASVVGANFEF